MNQGMVCQRKWSEHPGVCDFLGFTYAFTRRFICCVLAAFATFGVSAQHLPAGVVPHALGGAVSDEGLIDDMVVGQNTEPRAELVALVLQEPGASSVVFPSNRVFHVVSFLVDQDGAARASSSGFAQFTPSRGKEGRSRGRGVW